MSNPEWVDYYFKNNLQQHDFSMSNFDEIKSGFYILDQRLAPAEMEPVYRAAWNFNISQAFSIIDKKADYCDFFIFACPNARTDLKEFFLTHIDLFQQFIYHYKEKVFLDKDLSIYLQRRLGPTTPETESIATLEQPDICDVSKLNKQFRVRKLHMQGYLGEVWLTYREADYLACFIQGLTVKQVAKQLNISPRTAEGYLQNIQAKTGAQNSLQLYHIIAQDNLLMSYLNSRYQKMVMSSL